MRKKITGIVLTLMIALWGVGIIMPTMTEKAGASTNGHTQIEAVTWANNQVGTTHGNGQCVYFVRDYYDYLGQTMPTGSAYEYVNGGQYTPPGWHYENSPQPGDIAVWKKNVGDAGANGHVAIVTEIRGTKMVCVEANYLNNPKVTPNQHNIDASTYIRPDFAGTQPATDHNPVVMLDVATSNSAGTVTVKGWAFDPDDTSANLMVHVYAWKGETPYLFKGISANKSRPDVHNVYKCGKNHGFEATVPATVSGQVNINVAAINIGQGDSSWSEAKTITIKKDTTKPTISNVVISNISSAGYTVTCDVSDNAGVKEVSFPTWSDPNGQDDIVWHKGTIKSGKATCRIKTSDHQRQAGCKYITHIYAHDYFDNTKSVAAGGVDVPSPISNVKVTNISGAGYTVSCNVDTAWGVSRIELPTWTEENGQDDLVWHAGTISNGKCSYRVLTKDHGNAKCKKYITHIYVWDSSNNSNCVHADAVYTHSLSKTPATPATISSEGNIEYWACSECGKCFKDAAGKTEINKANTVIPKEKVKPIITVKNYTYDGKKHKAKPTVVVKDGDKTITMKAGVDYTLDTQSIKNIGFGSFKIESTANCKYSFDVKGDNCYFKVKPKGTKIKKLKKGKKAITVKWKKQAKKMSKLRITGYQIQLATDKKFKKNKKTIKVKGCSKTSKTIKNLKKKKTYYVRIRTYKLFPDYVNSEISEDGCCYSKWSKVKKIKTK